MWRLLAGVHALNSTFFAVTFAQFRSVVGVSIDNAVCTVYDGGHIGVEISKRDDDARLLVDSLLCVQLVPNLMVALAFVLVNRFVGASNKGNVRSGVLCDRRARSWIHVTVADERRYRAEFLLSRARRRQLA
jgi:hypothetical protein